MPGITNTIELVKKAKAGDSVALDELIARYYPRVLKVIRMRMGAKLRRRIESGDILQEVFATAVRTFERFDMRNEASFINWLSKIGEHVISDQVDRQSAKRRDPARERPIEQPEDDRGEPAWDIDAGFEVPLDQLIRDEERDVLEKAVAALPPHYRELIILRNMLNYSFKEIAEETERKTEGAARMMHAKAMAELVRSIRGREAD